MFVAFQASVLIWVFQEADANWVKHARNLSEEMEREPGKAGEP